MPAPMACTVPGRTKNTSPGCTATRLSTSQIVPSFARRRSSSGVTAREKPRKSVLSGLQSTTYHISVLPCSPFSRQAAASDGCT